MGKKNIKKKKEKTTQLVGFDPTSAHQGLHDDSNKLVEKMAICNLSKL